MDTTQSQQAVDLISAAHQRIKERYPNRNLNKVEWRFFEACDDYQEEANQKPQRFVVLEPDELKAILGGNPIEAGKAMVAAAIRMRGFLHKGVPKTGWYAQSQSADGSRTWFFLGETPEDAAAAYDSI